MSSRESQFFGITASLLVEPLPWVRMAKRKKVPELLVKSHAVNRERTECQDNRIDDLINLLLVDYFFTDSMLIRKIESRLGCKRAIWKSVILELGGKSTLLCVEEYDADIDKAVELCTLALFLQNHVFS
ncbi:aldehyde dehydrogenase family 2 member B4, mitochondrial-like protein [Tanacetum coccineum]